MIGNEFNSYDKNIKKYQNPHSKHEPFFLAGTTTQFSNDTQMNIETIETGTKQPAYELGEFVQYTDAQSQLKIGRLEEYNASEGWFECFVYLTPEQTPTGRQSHHGIKELFKSNIWDKGEAGKILRQVYPVKLKDYQKLKEENNLEDVFVVRQDYDSKSQAFLPTLQKCLCGRIPNPEDTLVLCVQCDKAFCANCLKIQLLNPKGLPCDFCRTEIPSALINAKFDICKQIVAPPAPIASSQRQAVMEIHDDEEEEEFTQRRPALDFEKLAKKIKQNDQQPALAQNRAPQKALPVIERQNSSSNKVRQFKNIPQEKSEKVIHLSEVFRLNESASAPNLPKKRIEVREKFFQLLWYGVEELRQAKAQEQTLMPSELQLIDRDDQDIYNVLKKLVLEIEVTLNMKLNDRTQDRFIESIKIFRCKIVYMHMKDDKNLELRRKVLTNELNAIDLCIKDERELHNPERRRETLEYAQLNFELNQKVNETPKPVQIEEEPEVHAPQKSKNIQQNEQQTSKHINQEIYTQVLNFLPKNQYQRIMQRYKTELKPDQAGPLINALQKVHKMD